jgi:hypothetical protein
VLGGVYLEKAVIQPLTDYVWLGGDAFSPDRLVFASRLFVALNTAISSLRMYYRYLDISSAVAQNEKPDGFPFIQEYESNKIPQTFTYLERLALSPDKLLYKARVDDRLAVVKFVSTYNAEAHRVLAERGLAPTLHYAGTEHAGTKHAVGQTYGGRYMIVMNFFDGVPPVRPLTKRQLELVKQAIELLHSRDLVFGDLRVPNILVKDESVMIIDFDWCGKAGEARYPATLNDAVDWPKGVEPDAVMLKEHDLTMLRKLPS